MFSFWCVLALFGGLDKEYCPDYISDIALLGYFQDEWTMEEYIIHKNFYFLLDISLIYIIILFYIL